VATRCPRLFYICKTRVLAVEPVHELLINNPLESRALEAPALTKRASRPLVSNRTLRGSGFSSAALGALEGFAYAVRSQAILMPTVVVVVACCGRAFSGGAAGRSGRRGQADVTARRGSLVAAP
jgi:hypothetical protein